MNYYTFFSFHHLNFLILVLIRVESKYLYDNIIILIIVFYILYLLQLIAIIFFTEKIHI